MRCDSIPFRDLVSTAVPVYLAEALKRLAVASIIILGTYLGARFRDIWVPPLWAVVSAIALLFVGTLAQRLWKLRQIWRSCPGPTRVRVSFKAIAPKELLPKPLRLFDWRTPVMRMVPSSVAELRGPGTEISDKADFEIQIAVPPDVTFEKHTAVSGEYHGPFAFDEWGYINLDGVGLAVPLGASRFPGQHEGWTMERIDGQHPTDSAHYVSFV